MSNKVFYVRFNGRRIYIDSFEIFRSDRHIIRVENSDENIFGRATWLPTRIPLNNKAIFATLDEAIDYAMFTVLDNEITHLHGRIGKLQYEQEMLYELKSMESTDDI